MSDNMPDWEKLYWKRKQQQKQQSNQNSYTKLPPSNPENLPHFDPADISKQIAQRSTQGHPGQNGWRDVDPLTSMYTNMNALASRGSGPQVQTVLIKPGALHYKPIRTEGFGTTMPLVRNCGSFQDSNGREFEMRQECKCYVIDDLDAVDLSNIDPKRLKNLVEVRAPFIGTILVEKNSIVDGPSDGGPQILKG